MLDTICAVKSIIWGEPITAQRNCDPLNIYMGVRFRKPLTHVYFLDVRHLLHVPLNMDLKKGDSAKK